MKKKILSDEAVDKRLKQVLKDDLPPEVETAMDRQLNMFREKMEDAQRKLHLQPQGFFSRLSRIGHWWQDRFFKQVVPAFATILLLVAVNLMQIGESKSAFAESISSLGTAAFAFKQMNHSESMNCTVRVLSGMDEPLKYSISRHSAGNACAHAKSPAKSIAKTLWLNEDKSVTIVDHAENTPGVVKKAKDLGHVNDPVFLPVLEFLPPGGLENRLKGKWRLKGYVPAEDRNLGTFAVLNPAEKSHTEVTIDMSTCLPVNIRTTLPAPDLEGAEPYIGVSMNLKWGEPPELH